MKLSVDSCSALNIPVVWQWRRWQFQQRAKWLFTPQCAGFDPRSRTLKDPDSLRTLLATSPLLVWMYSKGTSRPADLQDKSVKSQPYVRETFGLTVSLSICLSDWSTTITTIALPEIAVRDYLFGEPHLFFKWPYLSLKKWDTWEQWERGMFLWFLNFSVYRCRTLSSSRHRVVTEDTGHLLFSAFSWWSLNYVKASVP